MNSTESLLTTTALIAVIMVLLMYLLFNLKFRYWEDRGVPFVKPIIFFGSLKEFFFLKKNITYVYDDIYNQLGNQDYGGFYEFSKPVLMVKSPKLLQRILIKDFKYFFDRHVAFDHKNDPITVNLFTMKGEAWRTLRNKLTPTFTTAKMKLMFDQICQCGEELLKNINEESQFGKPLNGEVLLNKFAFDVIANCAFGMPLNDRQNITKVYQLLINCVFLRNKRHIFRIIFLMYMPKLAKKLGLKLGSKELRNFIHNLIKETLEYREKNSVIRNDFLQLLLNLRKQEESGKVHINMEQEEEKDSVDDIVDQMKHASNLEDEVASIEKKKEGKQTAFFTDSIILAQCFAFLSAGTETISITLNYCLYCLAQNPHVQEMLYNEVDSVLTSHEYQWSYEALKEMTYLDQIIQETNRLYPAVPMLFRTCTKHYKIPDTSVVVEKGTTVVVPVYSIHRDPNNYEMPENFDPSRFADNNYKPNGVYLPFGDGPRICIAMRFSILELKVVLAKLVWEYTVKLSSKTTQPITYSPLSYHLVPEGGIFFEFYKRLKL